MRFRRGFVVGVGLVGVAASTVAAAVLWLLVTDPVAVATFLAGGL
jgi:hypothetical protein